MCVSGEHEIYCCGSRVAISKKGVKVLTEPSISYCPLHESLYGTAHIDSESVLKSVEAKIAGQGFCCRNRSFGADATVAYGASEMMQVWLDQGIIDCAVVVCEGAGTVIATKGRLVQSIGARLTGIIRTSPIQEIIGHVEQEGGTVLDRTAASIDQVAGLERAFGLGFKRVAVTIAGFQAQKISEARKLQAARSKDVLIYSVCNTCVDNEAVEHIANADVVCASASRLLREQVGGKALIQLGTTIPVYALTQEGKRLVLDYLKGFKDKLVIFKTHELPYTTERKGPELKKRP